MFGSEILEVAIGLILVFLIVSVICSAVREAMEARLKTRAAYLERGIRELLHDKGAVGLARAFYNHPFIYSLYGGEYNPGTKSDRPSMVERGGDLPSYIPARNFALTLLDIASRGHETLAASSDAGAPLLSLATARANIANIENPAVQRALLGAIDTAQGDIDKAVANLAAWYDSGMDRVSGAYKRATQHVLFAIGLVVAVGLNIDTIQVARFLYTNDAARAVVVAEADKVVKAGTAGDTLTARTALATLDRLPLPVGWGAESRTSPVTALPGWLLTALAATFGAPFWFDLLNKVMVIRSTVKPHEKSPEESSEDRQKGAPRTAQLAEHAVGAQQAAAGDGGGQQGAGAPGAPPPPPIGQPEGQQPAAVPVVDEENRAACDDEVPVDRPTKDENLPPAFGGVA